MSKVSEFPCPGPCLGTHAQNCTCAPLFPTHTRGRRGNGAELGLALGLVEISHLWLLFKSSLHDDLVPHAPVCTGLKVPVALPLPF